MKVVKRDGRVVDFDINRIINAINKAMADTVEGIDYELTKQIATSIENKVSDNFTVEEIQDIIEEKLMNSNRKDVARQYIIYRNERSKFRKPTNNTRLLTDEFISKYKHMSSPMNQLGNFVYYRTYSRWIPEEKRREYWWETVRRSVEYNCNLSPTTKEEAEKLYDNIFNLKQFLSGRTFWVGGTSVAYKYPMSNFNCAFCVIDNFEAFKDLFYLLMVGTGFGLRILPEDVEQLPKIRTDIEIIHKDYISISKNSREDNTSIEFIDDVVKVTVGDSKEGWTQALDYLFKIMYDKDYRKINTIIFDYDNVRRKGEKLNTFGGTASGHESLQTMFEKIDKIIKNAGLKFKSTKIKLKPIHCLDIANIIGENVVVGGVRRTAENSLIDERDVDTIEAKNNLYQFIDGKWNENKDISHRKMSNNSIFYKNKPTRKQLHWQVEQMRFTGEPGFVNVQAAEKRRKDFKGLNPCFEVLLDSRGLCNLVTLNVCAFVNNKILDKQKLLEAQKLNVRAGYRMTNVELELDKWDRIQKRDRLLGCSLTGWQDMIDVVGMTKEQEIQLLKELKNIAHIESENIAKEINGNIPLLVTTIKPEGTISLLPGVSAGLHYSHSSYYIRRIRITANDPLVKVCEELEYSVYPETGEQWETCNTKVVEFPVKTYATKTKYDISAIEQLENYKRFMQHYVDHNVSITVTVKEDEWDSVEQWLWDNWDDVVAIAFLPLNNASYPLMPYESINKEEYEKRVSEMKPFIPSLINKYEREEIVIDIGNDGCESGHCPVR